MTTDFRPLAAGTVTPYEFAIALAENAVDNGAELKLNRKVSAIQKLEGADAGYVVKATNLKPKKFGSWVPGLMAAFAIPLLAILVAMKEQNDAAASAAGSAIGSDQQQVIIRLVRTWPPLTLP